MRRNLITYLVEKCQKKCSIIASMKRFNCWEEYRRSTEVLLCRIDIDELTRCVECFRAAMRVGGSLFLIGDEGCQSAFEHIQTDLMTIRNIEPSSPLFQLAVLRLNSCLITEIANNVSCKRMFSSQLRKFSKSGARNLVLPISVSGESEYPIYAFRWASASKVKNLFTISPRIIQAARNVRYKYFFNFRLGCSWSI